MIPTNLRIKAYIKFRHDEEHNDVNSIGDIVWRPSNYTDERLFSSYIDVRGQTISKFLYKELFDIIGHKYSYENIKLNFFQKMVNKVCHKYDSIVPLCDIEKEFVLPNAFKGF